MGKKTRYVRLDWTSAADASLSSSSRHVPVGEASDSSNPHQKSAQGNSKEIGGSISKLQRADTSSSEHHVNTSSDLATNIKDLVSQETPDPSEMPKNWNGPFRDASRATSIYTHAIPSLFLSAPHTTTSSNPTLVNGEEYALGPLPLSSAPPTSASLNSTPATHVAAVGLHDGVGKVSLESHRSVARTLSAEIPLYLRHGTNEAHCFAGLPSLSSLSKPQLVTSYLTRSTPETRSSSSTALASLSRNTEKIYPRKPVKDLPVPGKIYFLPDGKHFRDSVIHNQKQQNGFFQHPVLVIGTDGEFVQFYALTKEPPQAIRDLDMALRIGATHEDKGSNVLRLAPESDIMLQKTWINLEQRFFIEWRNLDEWAVHVRIHPDNFYKITRRVFELEADQNRFIYKPLLRDMSVIQPGMIIMLPNTPNSSTFGAPIVVIENKYPNFCFLRVKRFEDNIYFNPGARRRKCSSRAMSLAISKFPSTGHDGTPVLFLDEDSPEMRESSYVEIDEAFKHGKLDQGRTWCWPPVKISPASMAVLHHYIASVAVRNQPVYYAPPVGYEYIVHSTIPPPKYYTYQPQPMPSYYPPGGYISRSDAPAYPPGGYMSHSNAPLPPYPGSWSGKSGCNPTLLYETSLTTNRHSGTSWP
jgi:hypothetical protein